MLMSGCLDRLDGVYQRRSSASQQSASPIEKRVTQTSMNLDGSPTDEAAGDLQSKRKKVRWADVEESAVHEHRKAGRNRPKPSFNLSISF